MAEDKVRKIERTGDLRVLYGLAGSQVVGPTLQEAWICQADGRVEWRNVQVNYLPIADYHKATDSTYLGPRDRTAA